MDPIVGEYLSNKAAQTQMEGQIKLFKGALKQEGAVVMKLISSAVETAPSDSRQGFSTGQKLNVAA